ncbi:MAG: hypothetical protein QGF31_08325 [Nitrospinota bacterium]|jgi:hypothetical protein|nr:hypothetical protein [Nitrospinota bacterium]|tara:strand:+ start:105 stop:671 length:567 start_codon:yes stop_codon:yes gene_type:complete
MRQKKGPPKYVVGSKGIIETKIFQQFLLKEFIKGRSWAGVENIAKANGIYTADELHKLIKEKSPIKSIGEVNMQLSLIIHEAMQKDKNLSFHAACVNNMEKLCILIGIDPGTVSYGKTWMRAQKIPVKALVQRDYTQVIKILGNRYRRVMKKPKLFLTWYKQNKNSKEFPRFLMWMVKKLKSKNKSLK